MVPAQAGVSSWMRFERGRDARQAGLDPGAGVGARVQHHVADAVGMGAHQLVPLCVQALLPQLILGAGQVDEVAGVAHRIGDAQRRHLLAPARDVRLVDGRAGPLAIVLGEDLHRVGVNGRTAFQRPADAAGDGHVGAQQ